MLGRDTYTDFALAPELFRSYRPLPVMRGCRPAGRAPTLDEAKAQLQTNFRKWLVWAKLEGSLDHERD